MMNTKKIPGFKLQNIIEISHEALIRNYDYIQDKNFQSQIWPVLKSNAFRHGIELVAKIFNARSLDYIVVNTYQEAWAARKVSKHRVLLLGYASPDNYPYMNFKDLALTCV